MRRLIGSRFHLHDRVSIPVHGNGRSEIFGEVVGRCLSIHGLVYLVRCDRSGEIVRMTERELRHA